MDWMSFLKLTGTSQVSITLTKKYNQTLVIDSSSLATPAQKISQDAIDFAVVAAEEERKRSKYIKQDKES